MLIQEKIATFVTDNYPQGRYTFLNLPFVNHTPEFVFRDLPERQTLRNWVQAVRREVKPEFVADRPNPVAFSAQDAKFVRIVILASSGGQPCIDELEVYGPDGKQNLALASRGAKATASSCLPGYSIHQIAHLNDGLYGNSHSWIAASEENEWAQIELPAPAKVSKIVFSRDREGRYQDRVPLGLEVRLSLDGKTWKTAIVVKAANFVARPAPGGYVAPVPLPDPVNWDGLVRYAFLCEQKTWQRISPADHVSPLRVERPALPGGPPYWGRIARLDPLTRTLVLMEEMLRPAGGQGTRREGGAVAMDRTPPPAGGTRRSG